MLISESSNWRWHDCGERVSKISGFWEISGFGDQWLDEKVSENHGCSRGEHEVRARGTREMERENVLKF